MGKIDEVVTGFFKRKEVKKTGKVIGNNSIVAITLLGFGFFLYTYFNVKPIFDPPVDQQKLLEERQKLAQNQVNFEGELIERIQNLREVRVDTEPKQLGNDSNPFN